MTSPIAHESAPRLACFETTAPAPHDRVRIFCFPYAGGSWYIYRDWRRVLSAVGDVYPIQMPGRGMRFAEPLPTSAVTLAESLARDLAPFFDRPVVLFGHSMGALIAFELARALQAARLPEPSHLIVAGRQAPQFPRHSPPIQHLGDAEFLNAVVALGGASDHLTQDPDAMRMWLPILRADIRLVEDYQYQGSRLLSCPITALGGQEDLDVTRESLDAWRAVTTGRCTTVMVPGDHFFLTSVPAPVYQVVSAAIRQIQHRSASAGGAATGMSRGA